MILKEWRFAIAASAAIITGLAFTGYSYGAGSFHHREFSVMEPCVAVMSSEQRANLKQTFSTQKQTLMTDRQNVASAKKTLTLAILSGSKDVSLQETALSNARQQLQKDQDSTASQICGQLNSTQLSAAQTLFNNLWTLRENTHQQARSYFQAARAAAGNGSSE